MDFFNLMLSTHGGISRAELSKMALNLDVHDLRQFVEIEIVGFLMHINYKTSCFFLPSPVKINAFR